MVTDVSNILPRGLGCTNKCVLQFLLMCSISSNTVGIFNSQGFLSCVLS